MPRYTVDIEPEGSGFGGCILVALIIIAVVGALLESC